MVIYGYYLKKALMEELPLRDAEKTWLSPLAADRRLPRLGDRGLDTRAPADRSSSSSRRSRSTARICATPRWSARTWPISSSATSPRSSAINRIRQLGDDRTLPTRGYRSLARLTVAAYLEDVWRIYFRLRPVLLADGYPASRSSSSSTARFTQLHLPFDPVAEVHAPDRRSLPPRALSIRVMRGDKLMAPESSTARPV